MVPVTTLRVLAAPAKEPVSVALAKKHLRVDSDDQDDLIGAYIVAARSMAEQHLNRALITQTLQWIWAWDPDSRLSDAPHWGPYYAYPSGRHALELPRAPAQSVLVLSILDHAEKLTASLPLKANASAGATTLLFADTGFPGAIAGGTFVAELVKAAIPSGAVVFGSPVSASGTVTVTLSAPLAIGLVAGDRVVFSAVAPRPVLTQPLGSPPPGIYHADLLFEPARVKLDWSIIQQLGTVTSPLRHVEIDYLAGYGDEATAIPQPIVNAVLLMTAFLYERRGDDEGEMPRAARALLEPYRIASFGA